MKIIKIALLTICALSTHAPEALGGTLFDLIEKNKIEEVQKYLEKLDNDEVNQVNENGGTSLCWACHKGNLEMVKLLLKNGAKESVNKANTWGKAPLYWACLNNNLEMVELLLKNGAKDSVNKVDDNRVTPLYCACYNNNLKMVELLLNNGAKDSVNRANNNEETPLYWACYKDNLEIVKLLLNNGAKESVNKVDKDRETPLYRACWRNNLKMVELLLKNGADATAGALGKKAIETICSSKWTTAGRKKLLMSLLSVPEAGAETETEEPQKSRIFKELVVSSLAENMQQNSTVAPIISSNDGLRKYTGIANPEQVINQIETAVRLLLFTPFATVAKKPAHLWPIVVGSNSAMGIEKLVFRLSLRQLKAEFSLTHEHLMFLRNLQKVVPAYTKTDGKIVIPAKTMRKLCDLWFKFEYNNQ
ncbi:MAG: hypothetical protein UW09_C0004G0164 [candidate division TM6 bacterium GW2011_GWF2_43_87]|nr:MAG: hypothetical protein UW09_C0004G0164 [candidate division TM6 bacterium GW2011_GWF2_43_87]